MSLLTQEGFLNFYLIVFATSLSNQSYHRVQVFLLRILHLFLYCSSYISVSIWNSYHYIPSPISFMWMTPQLLKSSWCYVLANTCKLWVLFSLPWIICFSFRNSDFLFQLKKRPTLTCWTYFLSYTSLRIFPH